MLFAFNQDSHGKKKKSPWKKCRHLKKDPFLRVSPPSLSLRPGHILPIDGPHSPRAADRSKPVPFCPLCRSPTISQISDFSPSSPTPLWPVFLTLFYSTPLPMQPRNGTEMKFSLGPDLRTAKQSLQMEVWSTLAVARSEPADACLQ